VTSLVTLLRDIIAIKACSFCYKKKKQKSVTLLGDIVITKICCLRYVGKSKYIYLYYYKS